MKRPCRYAIQEAHQRQEANRRRALVLMLDWPQGMPPLREMAAGIGTLVALEKMGLARQIGRDDLGELRFVLTDEGRAEAGG